MPKNSHLVVVQPKAAAEEAQCMVEQERQAAHMLVKYQVVQGVKKQVALEKGAPAEVGICIGENNFRGFTNLPYSSYWQN